LRISRTMFLLTAIFVLCALAQGCAGSSQDNTGLGASGTTDVLTDTSFLADIVQNVVGDRLTVTALIPKGADPHSFEPTPADARRVAEAQAVVINVKGLLPSVDALVAGVGAHDQPLIEAAAGIPGLGADPHCWLDPLLVVDYVSNIAQRFSSLLAEDATYYQTNAAAYTEKLRELDSWIRSQVDTIPAEQRLLVTDHEVLGRFAARYGFKIVGAIFPTASGEGSPSARQLTELVAQIKATGAPAIFLETGSSPSLAEQVAQETGVNVVTDLYAHSLGEGASSYLEMMRWNVTRIVEALR
jgi:manganese/iron transport system substrate-binding protein